MLDQLGRIDRTEACGLIVPRPGVEALKTRHGVVSECDVVENGTAAGGLADR
jgi:hypothetical protein